MVSLIQTGIVDVAVAAGAVVGRPLANVDVARSSEEIAVPLAGEPIGTQADSGMPRRVGAPFERIAR